LRQHRTRLVWCNWIPLIVAIFCIPVFTMRKKKSTRIARSTNGRPQGGLVQLAAEWDRRLAVLNQPGAHERLDAVIAAGGQLKSRPKAGYSF
jgi:hypothetical protein